MLNGFPHVVLPSILLLPIYTPFHENGMEWNYGIRGELSLHVFGNFKLLVFLSSHLVSA